MLVRFCIIWPIAKSHIRISKKPISGARYFIPFDTNIILIVPRLTSKTRAKKYHQWKYNPCITL